MAWYHNHVDIDRTCIRESSRKNGAFGVTASHRTSSHEADTLDDRFKELQTSKAKAELSASESASVAWSYAKCRDHEEIHLFDVDTLC